MKTRILLIDDDTDFTQWLKTSLEMEGYYEVRTCDEPTEVIAQARQFWPDLILLDVVMPRVEGSEVAARLKNDRWLHDVPVLFLTNLVCRDEAPDGSVTSGGQTFVPKSLALDGLMDQIELALNASVMETGF